MLDAAANPISALLMLAVLVRTLNGTDYGALTVAIAASNVAMAVNPAIALTTTRFVSRAGSAQGHSAAGVLTSSLVAVLIVDATLMLACAAFQQSLSLWAFGSAFDPARGGHLLLLATVTLGIQQIDAVLSAGIRGLERFREQALLEVAMRTALTTAVVLVALRTRSPYAVLLVQGTVSALWLVARGAALRHMLPGRRLFELARPSQIASLLNYGGWMSVAAIAAVAYTNADRVLVGRVLGPVLAGRYNVYVQLTQLIHFAPSALFAFALPVLGRLAADATPGELNATYRRYFTGIGVTAFSVAACLMFFWPPLLRVLAGPEFDVRRGEVPWLLACNYLVLAFGIAPYYLLLAVGRPHWVSAITSSSMAISVVAMLALASPFGLAGVALGRVAYALGALTLVCLAHSYLGRRRPTAAAATARGP